MEQVKSNDDQLSNVVAPATDHLYYGWKIVGACFVVIALVSPLMASFSIFYVAVLEDFNWSRGSTAIALSLHLVLGGLAAPFAGALIDRYGPRKVMPLGAVITAVALISLGFATSLWHFYLAFGVVAAMGSALLHIVPLTTVVSNWFVRHRGTAIGIVSAGSGAGQLVLMPLMQYLIERIGWRNAYLILGLAILVIPTVLIRLYLYSHPEDRGLTAAEELLPRRKRQRVEVVVAVDGQEVERKPGIVRKNEVIILDQEWAETDWNVGKAVRTFRFWALMLMMAMFAAGFFLISVHLVAYLTDKGYSSGLAAAVVGLQGFINIIGKFAGGWLCDRIGREKTLTLSILIFIGCIVLLNLGGVMISQAIIYAFAVCYGLGYGIALPALIASTADLFQGKHFGSILGVIILGGFIGGALGTWLGGYFFDLTQAYQVNFWVAAGTMVVSALLIWKARPGRVRLVKTAESG
jgi:MFS family permease